MMTGASNAIAGHAVKVAVACICGNIAVHWHFCWCMSISFTLCGGYLDKSIKDEETHLSLYSKWAKVQDEVLTLRRRVRLEKQ
jgi:hypothetical protein